RPRAPSAVARQDSFWLRSDILHRLEPRQVDLAQGLFQDTHVDAAARKVHRKALHQNDAEFALFVARVVFFVDGPAADDHVFLITAVALRGRLLNQAAGQIHQTGDPGDIGDLDVHARAV